MPSYRYQVKTSAGEVQVGVIAADNVNTAAGMLRNQGFRVMSLNPVWGQGMTTALLQAGALAATLERRAGDRSGLAGLAGEYLPRVAELLAYPWRVAAVGDFAYEQTTGDRPPDLEEARRFNRGLAKLVEEDPEVHRLSERVRHLLDPPEFLASSGIQERVLALS